MRYKLEVNEEQLRLISESLDVCSRIRCGQLGTIRELFYTKEFNRESFDYAIKQLKIILFPKLVSGEYYGIYGDKTPMESKIGYDIYKNINHKLNRSGDIWNVNKDPHTHLASGIDCVVEEMEDEK